jgi:WD40 repeat protein
LESCARQQSLTAEDDPMKTFIDVTSGPCSGLSDAAWPRQESDDRPRLEAALTNISRALSQGRPARQFQHDGAVNGALLTRGESRILSWSWDHTLRLWDAATGKQIGPAMQHDNLVLGAILTRDESRILSWSDDKTLRLWDNRWPRGNLLEFACAVLPDHDLAEISRRNGIVITDPICAPGVILAKPDWSLIER